MDVANGGEHQPEREGARPGFGEPNDDAPDVWAICRQRSTDPLRLDRSEEPPPVRRCPSGRTLPKGSIIRNPVAKVDACPGSGACRPVAKGPAIAGLACLVGAPLVVLAPLSPSSAAPAFSAPGFLLLAAGICTLGVTGGFLVLVHSLGRELRHPCPSPGGTRTQG